MCNKNLLSKRYGELKDSILGIMFQENGKNVVFGDRLVKNVSGYNICRSNKVLNKNIKKICLRVFNKSNSKYYKLDISNLAKDELFKINSVSYDFTPLLVLDGKRKSVIFSSVYTRDELEEKNIFGAEEIAVTDLKKYRIKFIQKKKFDFYTPKEKKAIYNYQKEEMYFYEY